jgi:hypothetical protein
MSINQRHQIFAGVRLRPTISAPPFLLEWKSVLSAENFVADETR